MTEFSTDSISPLFPEFKSPQLVGPKSTGKGFSDLFKGIINEANSLQINAGQVQEKFLLGEIQDLHTVMIAAEEAAVAFNLVMEIRNKLLESYMMLMRMPI